MFINPNEFELLQHLDVPGRIEPDAGPDDEPGARPALRVTLRKLAKRYGERVVLDGLDQEFAPGEFVAVVGQSGCGKSTLLRLLAGLETASGEQGGLPTRSPVLFDNFPQWSADSRVRMMFQDARLLPWKTVLQNVALGLPGQARAQAAAVLRQVGLGDR
ncbi:sulfonate ABC transporter ATP-binding protein, partial [Streptomyces cavourensis]